MNIGVLKDLINNASLLLSISIISSMFFIKYKKNTIRFDILQGTLIGMVGILLMINTVSFTPGIIFDTRSILVSVFAMFFGTVSTVVYVTIICVYRIIIGGDGAVTGVIVTIMTALIGVLWKNFRHMKIIKFKNS